MSNNIGWLELFIIGAVIAFFVLMPVWVPKLVRRVRRYLRKRKKALRRYARRFNTGAGGGKDEVDMTAVGSKEASEAEEVKSTVDEIRESADLEGVLPGKKKAGKTDPGATAPKKHK